MENNLAADFLAAITKLCLMSIVCGGCGRSTPTAVTTRPAKAPTVASTVPAATDLIVGMGCADHLVAICNFDPPRPQTDGLPKAGDYLTIDWEVIGSTRPAILVTGLSDSRRPAGFDDRAARLHVQPVYLQVNGLADIDPAITMLGAQLNEPQKAAAAVKVLDDRLNAVRAKRAGRPVVPVLLVRDADPTQVIGPGSYLDDLLQTAGGVNVVTLRGTGYPTLDRETLVKLRPRVILQLLPAASPSVLAQAQDAWKSMPGITAPVVVITDPYALQPSWHVADLAEEIARDISGR